MAKSFLKLLRNAVSPKQIVWENFAITYNLGSVNPYDKDIYIVKCKLGNYTGWQIRMEKWHLGRDNLFYPAMYVPQPTSANEATITLFQSKEEAYNQLMFHFEECELNGLHILNEKEPSIPK